MKRCDECNYWDAAAMTELWEITDAFNHYCEMVRKARKHPEFAYARKDCAIALMELNCLQAQYFGEVRP